MGLYVDGAPVEGSGRPFDPSTPEELDTVGISARVPPGDHTITMRSHCSVSPGGAVFRDAVVGGILLGG